RRVGEWLAWQANRLAMSLPHLRVWRRFTPAGPALDAWFEARMHADLERLDLALRASPYLVGDAVTIADVSCCGYLFWADQAAVVPAGWPAIDAWLDRIRSQPIWLAPYVTLLPGPPFLDVTATCYYSDCPSLSTIFTTHTSTS